MRYVRNTSCRAGAPRTRLKICSGSNGPPGARKDPEPPAATFARVREGVATRIGRYPLARAIIGAATSLEEERAKERPTQAAMRPTAASTPYFSIFLEDNAANGDDSRSKLA